MAGLKFETTANGVLIGIDAGGENIPAIELPVMVAVQTFYEFWNHLGDHFPKARPDAKDEDVPPHMVTLGNLSVRAVLAPEGRVGLWLRPEDCAGIVYELSPESARELARTLLAGADAAEQWKNPN